MAASDAFGMLAEAFPHPSASDLWRLAVPSSSSAHLPEQAAPGPALQHFNIKTLLERGTALLASGGQVRPGARRRTAQIASLRNGDGHAVAGVLCTTPSRRRRAQEFEIAYEPGLSAKQRLERQRQMLKQKLGRRDAAATLVERSPPLQATGSGDADLHLRHSGGSRPH